MTKRKLLGAPYLSYRFKGFRRWAVMWHLYDFETGETLDRHKEFFTRWGAARWKERQRNDHRKIWNRL